MSELAIYAMGIATGLALGLLTLWLSYLRAKRSIALREAVRAAGGQSHA